MRNQIQKHRLCFFILLLFFTIIIRTPIFSLPIDNDTGARTYHASLILQGEPLYSTHHPNHHLPAIYYTYAFIFLLLGENSNSLQLFLIFWIWLNAIFLYKLGSKLTNSYGGMLASFLYVFIGSMTNIAGDTAQTELFVNTFMTISIWLSADLVQHKRKPIIYFLLGTLCAICFLYKAIYLAPIIVAISMIMLKYVFKIHSSTLKSTILHIVLTSLGFLTVILIVFGYFHSKGLLSKFLLVFTNGSGYVNLVDLHWIFVLIIPFFMLSSVNLFLLLFGMLNLTRSIVNLFSKFHLKDSKFIIKLMIIIWFAVSIIEAGFSKFIFFHYGLLLLPPLVLLAGSEITEFIQIIKDDFPKISVLKAYIFPGIFIISILGNVIFTSYGYLFGFIQYRSGNISLEDYAINNTMLGYHNVMASKIADYIETNSTSEDLILNWSELAQIPYLANRKLSTDTVWPLHLANLGGPQRAFISKPLYVIVGPSFIIGEPIPKWLEYELVESYKLDKTYDDFYIYRRKIK